MIEGRVLAGKYRLVNKLTAGGMGTVWLAEHIELGSPAAVKLLEPSIADSPEALSRFRREAQSAASLRSTNIVQVFDFGVDGQTPYIAMELLRGKSLAERLRRDRIIAPQETAVILWQVARAAAWAHSRGIIHRDLKPGNIFLSEDANDFVVKLLDFGIAKPLDIDLSATPVTLTGSIMGTPQYMSPEQASGRRQVDHRTDIWSFAIIAFECLTGCHAFQAETLGGLVLAICAEPMPIPSEFAPVPVGFDDWFAHATHRNTDNRLNSIAEAGDQLRAICGLEASASNRHSGFSTTKSSVATTSSAPITPKKPQDALRVTDSATTTTLDGPKTSTYSRARPLVILAGLLGTVAGVVSIIHFASNDKPVASSQVTPPAAPSSKTQASTTSPFALASVTAPLNTVPQGIASAAADARAASSSSSRPPAPASDTHPQTPVGKPPITRPAAPATSGAREPQPVTTSAKPASVRKPVPPLSSVAAESAHSTEPSIMPNCDPEVKKKFGICPRPGK